MASQYHPVESSWIQGVTYDDRTGSLTGHFTGGRTFTLQVSKADFEAFMAAPSKGTYWNTNWK